MTIKRIRELLGSDVEDLSDKQITEFDNQVGIFCKSLLYLIVKNNKQSKNALTVSKKGGKSEQ